jgi:hypothetical protein
MSRERRDPGEWIGTAVGAVLRQRFTLLLDQRQSELGADAHISAVVRRMRCNEGGAVLLDGKYLLTLEAHTEEMALADRQKPKGSTGNGGVHAAG